VVLLGGGPGGGPATASAITQALHWFDPPAGTVLHARLVGTVAAPGGGTVTAEREFWQSADHPEHSRLVQRRGAAVLEMDGDGAIYDARTDTIYLPGAKPGGDGKPAGDEAAARAAKRAAAGPAGRAAPRETEPAAEAAARAAKQAVPADASAAEKAAAGAQAKRAVAFLPPGKAREASGDPTVTKIRTLLASDRAAVRGREVHDGVEAWAISLKPGIGGPAWTLWVAVADGRPLALHDPGDAGTGDKAEDDRWTAYDVQPAAGAEALLTVAAAHPGARVVRDAVRYDAASRRLEG
jgi:hypothetical protein